MTEHELHATLDECFEYNNHLREARDLNHAVQLISQLPGFEYGLGPVEIRPVADIIEMALPSKSGL